MSDAREHDKLKLERELAKPGTYGESKVRVREWDLATYKENYAALMDRARVLRDRNDAEIDGLRADLETTRGQHWALQQALARAEARNRADGWHQLEDCPDALKVGAANTRADLAEADLEVMNDRLARACDVLNAADKCFDGWSYGDMFSRVEKMRVLIAAFLAELGVVGE